MIEDLQLNDIRKFTSSIKEKYNYDFSEFALASFKRKLVAILNERKFNSIDDYLEKLLLSEESFNIFLQDITVEVTEMFRDPEFWLSFKQEINKKTINNKLRIWLAGCSTGEELFSLAILLKEVGLYDKSIITATDFSSLMLKKIEKREFSLLKMETNKKNYLKFEGITTFEKYYTADSRRAIMNDDLLTNVELKQHLLFNEEEKMGNFDIIICRNIMIYFNSNLQDKVFKLFDASLKLGGNLIIGVRESLQWSSIAHKYIIISDKEKIYKKIDE